MSSSTLSANWVWPLFPVAFVGLWIAVCFFISLAGWASFAIHYPARTRPVGTTYNSRVTRFGSFQARYGNVVRVIPPKGSITLIPAYDCLMNILVRPWPMIH
jgi:hypothetical protein